MKPGENNKVIISSLKKLPDDKLISVYAFIIMPNHIHLIWSQDGMHGKETPKGSLYLVPIITTPPTRKKVISIQT